MSFENPTTLQIGMTGKLASRKYRVVGRVVMSVTDAGETYYWNEFNLENDDQENATLVYEETEGGGEWKLFTMFEPEYPMTAADAATKHVGDHLNLDGTDVVVTFVDRSRVQYIQGKGPDGLQVREVAKYFNAEAGDVMQVVSWTGEEVEYYKGIQLSNQAVILAFNLPRQTKPARYPPALASSSLDDSSDSDSYFSGFGVKAMIAILVVIILFTGRSCAPRYHMVPVKKVYAEKPTIKVGGSGLLDGKKYQITSCAGVEIAEVNRLYYRHEYLLTDEYGKQSLLVYSMNPNSKDWTLYTPLFPLLPLTTTQAAAKKLGESVNIDGVTVNVGELFRSSIHSLEGESQADWKLGSVSYGFSGKSDYQSLLVR